MEMGILSCGDSAVMVELGDTICPETADRVAALCQALNTLSAAEGLDIEPVPTYCGVMLHYNPLLVDEPTVRALVTRACDGMGEIRAASGGMVEIPVCYGGPMGPDLAALAAHCGLSEQEVIDIHSGGTYRVYMLGFTPGFPFLGGMDKRIAMPRLESPRARIPWGSVGIAGEQTGIYPSESPGGWRLIGRTPLRLFDAQAEKTLLQAGMELRFKPIPMEEYLALGGESL